MKKLLGLLGVIVLTVAPATPVRAGHVNPFVSGPIPVTQLDRNVEPWVNFGQAVWNPTQCWWDPDDQASLLRRGSLDGGVSATFSGCLIANADPLLGFSWAVHPRFRFRVDTSDSLTAQVCYQPQNYCVAVPLNTSVCISGPFYDPNSPTIMPIPGSNGGSGVPTTVTFTITNPGTHRAIGWAIVSGGNDQDQCPGITETSIAGSDYVFKMQP